MEDIAPELLEKIQRDFQTAFDKNAKILELYEKIKDGTADYQEANDFAVEAGNILAEAYRKNLSSEILPDGKMYYNIAQRIIDPTMKNNYGLVSDVTARVQQSLNEAANIGIKAIKPELNQDRIDGLINMAARADNYDKVSGKLMESLINFSMSVVNDSVRVNAQFHAEAGLEPKIVRKLAGGCCEWCRNLAGTYNYPDDVPENFFRKHQYCRCVVLYYPGDGKVQNSHTKKWRNETEVERRKNIGLITENEKLATKFKRTFDAVPQSQVVDVMRKDSKKWIDCLSKEDIRCIQKYTLNEVKENPKFYERLNAMLRGELPEEQNLRYYANTISNALKKSTLENNVVCYRGLDINPIENIEIGKVVSLNQFTSTTVSASKSFDKKVKMVIYAKKETKGVAYIENISKMPKQRELLFDKDCIYRVLSNSKELIELEVI